MRLIDQSLFENRNNRVPNWIRYFLSSEFSKTDLRILMSHPKIHYMSLIDQCSLENTDNRLPNWIRNLKFSEFPKTDYRIMISDPKTFHGPFTPNLV